MIQIEANYLIDNKTIQLDNQQGHLAMFKATWGKIRLFNLFNDLT